MNDSTEVATAPRTGTQSVERAMQILREIAGRGRIGWRLKDLAERCGLDRATTYRLLACLVRERMVRQRGSDRHYFPGPLLFELSLASPVYGDFQAAARAPVERLHLRFGTLAGLFFYSGSESVCLVRAGQAPYLGARLEVGTRAPLMANAAGVAILIALEPAEEAQRIHDENMRHLAHLGKVEQQRLERMLRRSERLGYAFNRSDVTRGVHSFGMPLRHRGKEGSDEVFGSVMLSGQADQLPVERVPEVIGALRSTAAQLESMAAQMLPS